MFESIQYFAYLLDVEPQWVVLIIVLLLALGVVKSLYPWQPKWKSKQTKDENGDIITRYYHLDE